MSNQRPPAIAVVDPQTPGNIGTIARAMKNFGFKELILIDAPDLDPDGEAYGFAGQAREDILPNHCRMALTDLQDHYYTIGFTASVSEDDNHPVRHPAITPTQLKEELTSVTATTALVFGREDSGLTNDELSTLDRICTIPASQSYPSLNLGQAVTVTLYELRQLTMADSQVSDGSRHRATEPEIEQCYQLVAEYLDAINYPEEKREKAMLLVRRLLSRSHPTEREIITLLGLIRRGIQFADPPTED